MSCKTCHDKHYRPNGNGTTYITCSVCGRDLAKQRTGQQNRALHKFFAELAVEFNNRGLDMRTVLKPEIEIPWDERSVKEHLWKPLQKVALGKESTTELTTSEVSKVYEMLDRHLLTKFDINMAFPSSELQYYDEQVLPGSRDTATEEPS